MDVFGTVATAVNLASKLAQYAQDVASARDDIEKLRSKVLALSNILTQVGEASKPSQQKPLALTESLKASLNRCDARLQILATKLEIPPPPPKEGREAKLKRIIQQTRQKLQWPFGEADVREEVSALQEYLDVFGLAIGLDTRAITISLEQKVDKMELRAEREVLSKLDPLVDAKLGSNAVAQRHRTCLHGTRTAVLREIFEWAVRGTQQPIFWLTGLAGTGKSTIALTCANSLQSTHTVAGFFFVRGGRESAKAIRLLPTLAYQLAIGSPELQHWIAEAIQNDPQIATATLDNRLEKLLLQPLREVRKSSLCKQRFLIVIDALDECDDRDEISILIRKLGTCSDLSKLALSILLISRPEIAVQDGFNDVPTILRRRTVLHEQERALVDQDIAAYVSYELERVRNELTLGPQWPDVEAIEKLVVQSAGLFIYAATACRYIEAFNSQSVHRRNLAEKRLNRILTSGSKGKATEHLDTMYSTVLNALFVDEEDLEEDELKERVEHCRKVLTGIALVHDNLSVSALAKLIFTDFESGFETVHEIVMSTQAVLYITSNEAQTIQIIHESFREYLLDNTRCQDPRCYIQATEYHEHLAANCLYIMEHELHRDMCNLESMHTSHLRNQELSDARGPGVKLKDVGRDRIATCISAHLSYACRYWISHVEHSKQQISDNSKVHRFLQEHFLHWLEALSWLGRVSDAIALISTLKSLLQLNQSVVLSIYLEDARRFTLQNRFVINLAPLQTYCSALIFAPTRSIVRQQFIDEIPKWLCLQPMVASIWGAEVQKLEGHNNLAFSAVAFSPDGQTVASGSLDGTVRLWNARTGEETRKLEGHDHPVNAVAFSPDGQTVASGSEDATVRLWNARTGEETRKLEEHKSLVSFTVVAFSPVGQTVASGSLDGTVRLWNTARPGEEAQKLEGHDGPVAAVAFSPDGQTVVSGSLDGTVRLWNTNAGKETQKFEGRGYGVIAVAFSPDGQTVAYGSEYGTVQLSNTCTGETQKLTGHIRSVNAVAFSPDGQTVVTASEDWTVRLWSVRTGEEIHQFKEVGCVDQLAFHDPGTLITDDSILDVRPYVSLSQSTYPPPTTSRVALHGQWVKYVGQDLLWLPLNYRGVCSAVYGDTLVVGQASGAVSFFRITIE